MECGGHEQQAQELEDLVKEKFVVQKLLQVDYDSMELLECKHECLGLLVYMTNEQADCATLVGEALGGLKAMNVGFRSISCVTYSTITQKMFLHL